MCVDGSSVTETDRKGLRPVITILLTILSFCVVHLCASVHVWRFFGVQGVQCPLVCKCVSPGEDNSAGHLTEGLQTAGIT